MLEFVATTSGLASLSMALEGATLSAGANSTQVDREVVDIGDADNVDTPISARQVGCSVCFRPIAVTAAEMIRIHGPVRARCPGSRRPPVSGGVGNEGANHLHTYGVLTHLSLMVCNTHQIFGVLTHLLLKVCNTHQIFGLLTHTVTEGMHYTPNIWSAHAHCH